MSAVSRAGARAALAGLLATALPTATVYAYQPDDLNGVSPVVCVTSAGSERSRLTLGDTRGKAQWRYEIHSFALYRDQARGRARAAAAEDELDAVEAAVATVILSHPRHAAWLALTQPEATLVGEPVNLGGVIYLHEVIPVLVTGG